MLNVPAKQYERDGSDVRSPLSSTRTGIILLVQHDRTLGAMHCNVESVSSLDPRRTILAPGAVYSRCAPPATAVFGSVPHSLCHGRGQDKELSKNDATCTFGRVARVFWSFEQKPAEVLDGGVCVAAQGLARFQARGPHTWTQ